MDIVNVLMESLSNTFHKLGDFLPTLFGAFVILIIGWIIAKIIKWSLLKILKLIKFDSFADKAGVNKFLVKGGVKFRASGLIAILGYWIVMFTVLVMFFNALGLEVVSNLLNDVIMFIPNIIVACILLVVGMYLAELVSGLVVGSLKGADFTNPELVGKIAYGAVMFFTIAIALNQLHIGDGIIDKIVTAVVGGIGLAVAIAFGLGGKNWAERTIDKYTK